MNKHGDNYLAFELSISKETKKEFIPELEFINLGNEVYSYHLNSFSFNSLFYITSDTLFVTTPKHDFNTLCKNIIQFDTFEIALGDIMENKKLYRDLVVQYKQLKKQVKSQI